jgi:hypothetical protein
MDPQSPHTEDEVDDVVRGMAQIKIADEGLTALIFFAPVEYSNRPWAEVQTPPPLVACAPSDKKDIHV